MIFGELILFLNDIWCEFNDTILFYIFMSFQNLWPISLLVKKYFAFFFFLRLNGALVLQPS